MLQQEKNTVVPGPVRRAINGLNIGRRFRGSRVGVRQNLNAIAVGVGTAGADVRDAGVQGNNNNQGKNASSAGEESAVDNLAGSIWVLRGESLRTQVGRPAILSAHRSGHCHRAHTAQ